MRAARCRNFDAISSDDFAALSSCAVPRSRLRYLAITPSGVMPPDAKYLREGDPRAKRPGERCLGIRDTRGGGFLIVGDTTMSGY